MSTDRRLQIKPRLVHARGSRERGTERRMSFEAVATLPDSYFGVTLSRVVVSVFHGGFIY